MHLSLNECKVILSAKRCRSLNPHTVLLFFPRGRGDPDCQQQHECAQSCPTLHNPLDYSPPGSSVHGISQARILVWVGISYSRGSSLPTAADLVYLTIKVDHFWTHLWTFLYPLLYNKIIFIKNHGMKPIIRMARKKKKKKRPQWSLSCISHVKAYIYMASLFIPYQFIINNVWFVIEEETHTIPVPPKKLHVYFSTVHFQHASIWAHVFTWL